MMLDFLYTLFMGTEIFVAAALFLWKVPKRSYFYIRLIGYFLVMEAFSFDIQLFFTLATGWNVSYGEPSSIHVSLFKFFFYLFIFLMTIIAMWRSFNVSFFSILLYCAGGYALQHIVSNIIYLIQLFPFYEIITFHNGYAALFYEIPIYALFYFIAYKTLIVRQPYVEGKAERMKKRIIISFCVILLCIGLSRLTKDASNRSLLSIISESIYAIVSNIFVLFFLNILSKNDALDEKVDIMEEMLHRERQQYIQSKENMELINIKVHDLKHQIQLLKKDNTAERFAKVEKAIKIYDSQYKTGNGALDLILTDKSLLCEKNKITLTCACDGNLLSFMEETDIYSLFGNALSNAIESVSNIQEEDKRCISLNVNSRSNILSIHVENYFIGNIEFQNGLPVTKKDQSWHGFGMKSMSSIVKKYNGSLVCTTNDEIFYLDVVLPIPN